MDKLIELLNEYEGKELYFYDDGICCDKYDMYEVGDSLVELEIISKRYGFIKRLVENDKIDPEGILAENLTYTHFQIPPQYFRGGKYKNITEQMLDTFYLRILACLSIQDNPIEFLISILKD